MDGAPIEERARPRRRGRHAGRRLPTSSIAGITDAKVPDAQHGYEKCLAVSQAARALGATIERHNRVTGVERRTGGEWRVRTGKADIIAEHVVIAAGSFAPQVGAWFGLKVPSVALLHHYFVTDPMRCDEVEGMDRGEGDALLDRLYAHCDRPRFQYSHRWRPGDVLIWDNRSALHQATFDFDPSQRRYLHRIMLRGNRPLLAV